MELLLELHIFALAWVQISLMSLNLVTVPSVEKLKTSTFKSTQIRFVVIGSQLEVPFYIISQTYR